MAHENNIFFFCLAGQNLLFPAVLFPSPCSPLNSLRRTDFSSKLFSHHWALTVFASLEHVRARAEMKGQRQCQLHWGPGHWWAGFLMNREARDLKRRSGFTEGWGQYASGLLNPGCADIDILPIAAPPRSTELHWAARTPHLLGTLTEEWEGHWTIGLRLNSFPVWLSKFLASPFSRKECKAKFSKCFQEKDLAYRWRVLLSSPRRLVLKGTILLIPIWSCLLSFEDLDFLVPIGMRAFWHCKLAHLGRSILPDGNQPLFLLCQSCFLYLLLKARHNPLLCKVVAPIFGGGCG